MGRGGRGRSGRGGLLRVEHARDALQQLRRRRPLRLLPPPPPPPPIRSRTGPECRRAAEPLRTREKEYAPCHCALPCFAAAGSQADPSSVAPPPEYRYEAHSHGAGARSAAAHSPSTLAAHSDRRGSIAAGGPAASLPGLGGRPSRHVPP